MLWQVPANASGSGIDAVDEQARVAGFRGLFDRRDKLVGQDLPRVLKKDGAAADDVDSCSQDLAIVLERVGQTVIGHRGVDGALGIGRQHFVEVGGGGDARRIVKSRKLCGVPACFRLGRDPDAGEFESRVGDQLGQRVSADVARADLCDFDGHRFTPHRSGMGRSRLGTVSPPSISSIFPVRKLPAGDAR
jgi:hypothetical protein